MKHDISCVLEQESQAGAIYISNLRAASSLPCRKKYNIRSIISVATGAKLTQEIDTLLNYLHLPALDHPHYDLKQHFQQTFQFIQKARSQGNILVHCMAGISRSAAIVAAYMIRKQFLTAQQAITVLHNKRSIVNPNVGFRYQLKVLQKEMSMLKKNSMTKQNLCQNASLQLKLPFCKNESQQLRLPTTIPSCNLQDKKSRDQENVSKSLEQLPTSLALKSKTVTKIQRIKANMINQMEKSSKMENGFQDLLASNIYRNKLRLR